MTNPADIGRQVAREVLDLGGQFQGKRKPPIAEVEAFRRGELLEAILAAWPPGRLGQPPRHVLREPEGFADFADGAAPAIADDGADDRRAVAAVAVVDVLDDLLAPLMLEIDVDVGRFIA